MTVTESVAFAFQLGLLLTIPLLLLERLEDSSNKRSSSASCCRPQT
jgi:hypothetical protein